MNISFATAGALAEISNGNGTFSGQFTVHNNAVSFGFDTTNKEVTVAFAGGGMVALQGAAFEAATGTNMFSGVNGTLNTGFFGTAGSIPSFT